MLVSLVARQARPEGPRRVLDPAAWGSDHAGKPLPQFTSGDECLFCHRTDVGPTWAGNRHNRTVRAVEENEPGLAALKKTAATKEIADEVKYVLGRSRRQRFLKPGAAAGALEMLSVAWAPPARSGGEGRLIGAERPHWDAATFGDSCAGCHATVVDAKDRTYQALALDCFVCHGNPPGEHTKDTSLVHLAKKRKDPARVVTSLCGQCHLRTGRSKATGRPYATHFVPGDNLFRDFQVDLSVKAIQAMNPADGHVAENVRDVVLLGKEDVTCLSCHDVHKASSRKHYGVTETDLCLHCHEAEASKKVRKSYEVHSRTCGY
jgi:predicted CXXCH cytochrome family protein